MIAESQELSANVVRFCRLLRERGVASGPAEVSAALRSLSLIRVGDPEEFRLALRTVLPGSRRELAVFDETYSLFWLGTANRKAPREKKESESPLADLLAKKVRKKPSLLSWNSAAESEGEEALPGYSPVEVLKRKDFGKVSPSDVEEAVGILRSIAQMLARRLSRRYRITRKQQLLDFRKTMRQSLRTGGEAIRLAYRRRSERRSRIILLCDVSGSMESYGNFLITFLYSLQQAFNRVETFVFSTALHRVTQQMKGEELAAVLREISNSVQDWAGGTRIGECLDAFLEDYGRVHLNRETVVLILSDGWDLGEPELLEKSIRQIRRRAGWVVWLNPLMGSPGYEPACEGMKSALPYIDALLPAHNLESLQDLAHHLINSKPKRLS